MTAERLIELLKNTDLKSNVQAWDPDTGTWQIVTGIVYGGDNIVRIYTDDIS